jgi:uncharacterized protein YqgV (UPF0045/DUF77 family)
MLPGVVRAEFTIYPFIGGEAPPHHVQVAIDEINKAGLKAELGPLSSTVSGSAEQVLDALHRAESAALAAGATSIVIRLEVEGG